MTTKTRRSQMVRKTLGALAAAAALLVAGPATAAHADATLGDDGAVLRFDAVGGRDVIAVYRDAGSVVFGGGTPITASAPCTSLSTARAACPTPRPIVADLGDQDDAMTLTPNLPSATIHGGEGNDRVYAMDAPLVALGEDGDDKLY